MSKIDYAFKSKILKTDLCQKVKKIDFLTYQNSIEGIVNDPVLENEYTDLLFEYGYDEIHEASKINNAGFKRTRRLQKRILSYLLSGQCIFATFTFTDDVLNNTSLATRRRYLTRYLKTISNHYLANIDFGSTTDREHYHAVILTDFIDSKWQYGFTWFEKVRLKKHEKDNYKLAKYLAKLTNHAIKQTTRRYSLIYSRDVDKN